MAAAASVNGHFYYDLLFSFRYQSKSKSLPLLTSSCPGWICYAEKTHGHFILPYISETKSPQQIMGSLVKYYLSKKFRKSPDLFYHVTVMQCFDKKLEASREDFYNDIYKTRDVDLVVTSVEVESMLNEKQIGLKNLPSTELDKELAFLDHDGNLLGHAGSSSDGYLEYVAHYTAKYVFNMDSIDITYKILRNKDFQEVVVSVDGEHTLRFAFAYGFRNIQNVVQKIKRKKCQYDFIEIMACPSGCLNGGGQIRAETKEEAKELLENIEVLYKNQETVVPEENENVLKMYEELVEFEKEIEEKIFTTQYHEIEKTVNALNIKW